MPAWNVKQSVRIEAPASKVYDTIADYGTWTSWSPWLIADPATKVEVSATPNAVGSKYHWTGTVVGEGELEHLKLEPYRLIEDELRFLKPMKTTCKTAFELEGVGSATQVTWTMDAKLPWFLFWMVPMVKRMVGMDYQRGLNMLKDLVELGEIPSKTRVCGVEQVAAVRMAGFAGRCSVDEVNAAMERTQREVAAEFEREGLPTTGAMIAVYTKFLIKEGVFEYILGYMLPESLVLPTHSPLKEWRQGAGRALHVEHIGSYRHLGNAWSVANQVARFQKLRQCRTGTYEIYTTTPPETLETALQTDIYLPLR